jgi:thioredoxin
MLQTNLTHIENELDLQSTLEGNDNVMVTCGRMGPMCIPVYDIMEGLERKYEDVAFRDMAFDSPIATEIKGLPDARTLSSLPFVVYYKNGKVTKVTGGIQTKKQVKGNLDDLLQQ